MHTSLLVKKKVSDFQALISKLEQQVLHEKNLAAEETVKAGSFEKKAKKLQKDVKNLKKTQLDRLGLGNSSGSNSKEVETQLESEKEKKQTTTRKHSEIRIR